MRTDPPLPKDIWDLIPPVAQAAILALVEKLEQRISDLEQQAAQLTARLNQNSRNSSRPPSSDGPAVKRSPPRQPSGRKRGAQPGHKRHERSLVPLDQVHEVIICKPEECRRCGAALTGDDPRPRRHQVVELPPIQPQVTEYQLHSLPCHHCGISTSAPLPDGVATGSFGPRFQSLLAMCSGLYRMSKRTIENICSDVFGVSISTGEICALERATAKALDQPVAEARAYVQQQPINMDETGWRENRQRGWLWVAVTTWVSVFFIRLSRGAKVAQEIVGDCYRQVLTSDRLSSYNWIPLRLRQICWAHLMRDFQAMIDRGGAGAPIGHLLLGHAQCLISWWHRVRDGTLARSTFQDYVMRWLRPAFCADLQAGADCACARTAGTCRKIQKVETALWTFVRREGIEPTNNAAERNFRHPVQWRQTSYGTDSLTGSHFVENILTALASCRQQGRNILQYLTSCCQAAYAGTQAPSLLPEANGQGATAKAA